MLLRAPEQMPIPGELYRDAHSFRPLPFLTKKLQVVDAFDQVCNVTNNMWYSDQNKAFLGGKMSLKSDFGKAA